MLPPVGLVRLMAGAALVAVSGCGAPPDSAELPSADSTGLEVPFSPVTDRFVRCLEDEGWDAQASWGGGIEVPGTPLAQQSQVNEAMERCGWSSGWSTWYNWPAWSEDQIRELYRQEVAEHECLIGIGADSPEPPSVQAFIDTFATGEQYYAMMPAILNPEASGHSLESLQSTCPPPTWFPNMDGF